MDFFVEGVFIVPMVGGFSTWLFGFFELLVRRDLVSSLAITRATSSLILCAKFQDRGIGMSLLVRSEERCLYKTEGFE